MFMDKKNVFENQTTKRKVLRTKNVSLCEEIIQKNKNICHKIEAKLANAKKPLGERIDFKRNPKSIFAAFYKFCGKEIILFLKLTADEFNCFLVNVEISKKKFAASIAEHAFVDNAHSFHRYLTSKI